MVVTVVFGKVVELAIFLVLFGIMKKLDVSLSIVILIYFVYSVVY